MSTLIPREIQLAEIRQHIADRREDVAECRNRADKCQQQVSEHLAEAARSEEMVRRWEAVYDIVRRGVVPTLDGCLGPRMDEPPW